MAGPAQPAIRRRLIAAARGAVAAVLLLTTQSPAPVAAQDGGISLIRDAEIEAMRSGASNATNMPIRPPVDSPIQCTRAMPR